MLTQNISNCETSIKRYPNLSTVIMVEEFMQKNQDNPLKITQIKELLPKKVMHQTLKIILNYLENSGKVIQASKGYQWIYTPNINLKELKNKSIEL